MLVCIIGIVENKMNTKKKDRGKNWFVIFSIEKLACTWTTGDRERVTILWNRLEECSNEDRHPVCNIVA